MDIKVITLHKELPSGVDMVLYEPPFSQDAEKDIIKKFSNKYGRAPALAYKINHQYFVLRGLDHGK